MIPLAALRAEAETLARQLPALVGAVAAFAMTAKAEPIQNESDCLTKTFLAFSSLSDRWEDGELRLDNSLDHDLLYHEVRLTQCHANLTFEKTGIEGSVFDMKSKLESQPGAADMIQRYQSPDGRKVAFEDSLSCVSDVEHNKCVEAISR